MIIYIQILAYIIFIAWYMKNSISIIKYWGSLGSEELEQTDHIRETPVFRQTKIKLLTGLFVMAISLLSGMREFIPIEVFAMIIAISELYVHLTWFAWKQALFCLEGGWIFLSEKIERHTSTFPSLFCMLELPFLH